MFSQPTCLSRRDTSFRPFRLHPFNPLFASNASHPDAQLSCPFFFSLVVTSTLTIPPGSDFFFRSPQRDPYFSLFFFLAICRVSFFCELRPTSRHLPHPMSQMWCNRLLIFAFLPTHRFSFHLLCSPSLFFFSPA